jgi:hypothetical protein
MRPAIGMGESVMGSQSRQLTGIERAACVAPLALLMLTACSRASLLGGPGPEVAHHASPAEIERLAVAEPVRKFKTKDACKAHLEGLAQGHEGAGVVQISKTEFRTYSSKPWGGKEIHHEYSCLGKELIERSWSSKAGGAEEHHAEEAH